MRALRRLAPALLLAGLAACGAPEPPRTAGVPAPVPPLGRGDGGFDDSPQPPASEAEIRANPARLKGARASVAATLLGRPDFLRRERPAEIWQYYGSTCVLDLFLYGEGEAKSVAHVELRGRGPARGTDSACLAELFGRGPRPSS